MIRADAITRMSLGHVMRCPAPAHARQTANLLSQTYNIHAGE